MVDKERIIKSIKIQCGVEIPALQTEYNLSYKEAREIVEELLHAKVLQFESGIHFVINPEYKENEKYAAMNEQSLRLGMQNNYRDALEQRKQTILDRMKEQISGYRSFDDIDEAEYNKAVEIAVKHNEITAYTLYQEMSLDYRKARDIMDKMAEEDIISYLPDRSYYLPRKVLITQQDIDKKLQSKQKINLFFDDEDFDDDDDCETDVDCDGDDEIEDDDNDYTKFYRPIWHDEAPKTKPIRSNTPFFDVFIQKKHKDEISTLSKSQSMSSTDITIKENIEKLVSVLKQVAARKSENKEENELKPYAANKAQPIDEIEDRLYSLIKSDRKMTLKSAIIKAGVYIEVAKAIGDEKLLGIYKGLLARLKAMTPYAYLKLRQKLLDV